MDLVWVFERRRHTLLFLAPLGPSDQLGALRLYAEVTKALIRIKPAREGHQSHIHKPNFFTTEVRLLSKLAFQKLKALYEFLLGCFLLFSFGRPYLPSKSIELWGNNGVKEIELFFVAFHQVSTFCIVEHVY